MDDEISIINSNNRNDKIKNLVTNNKNKIIIFIVIILVFTISFYSFDKYKINQKKKISDDFNLITLEYSERTKNKTSSKLIEIINQKDPTYSPLSLYFIIDNEIITDQNKINSFFDILINEIKLDREIKNLIIYKKASYNADNIAEGKLLSILNPIINSDSIWKSHALYLMAEFFYAKKQNQKAKEFFNQILVLENSNFNIKQEAEKRLIRDLSE